MKPKNSVDDIFSPRQLPLVPLCSKAGDLFRENKSSLPALLTTAVLPTLNWEASLLDTDLEAVKNGEISKNLHLENANVEKIFCEDCDELFKDKINF